MHHFKFPLNIQLFAENGGADPANPDQGARGAQSSTPEGAGIDYEQLANVISKRTSGTEEKVLQGYFKQQGLSAQEAQDAIRQYKENQKKQRDAETERIKGIEAENARLKQTIQNAEIDRKINELSAKEGVSSDKMPFLLKMIEREGLVQEDGKVADDKAKEALDTVLKAFPEFKGSAGNSGVQPLIGGNGGTGGGSQSQTEAALDAIFGRRK